jgi:hypothetical protein
MASASAANPLEGKPLRYLIGKDGWSKGADGEVTEVGYDVTVRAPLGIGVKYVNLFDEKNSGQYRPYLHSSDTAAQYGEGQIDPAGPGWRKNLTEQLTRAKVQGFGFVELDNPDAYKLADVLGAVDLAASNGLHVIAKNPLLIEGTDPTPYLAHTAVMGAIVERGAGSPPDMDKLRQRAGKPELPVWFVAFRDQKEDGRPWAANTARLIANANYSNMRVTVSDDGEYTSSRDAASLVPAPVTRPLADYGADDIVRGMKAHNCEIDVGTDKMNIVYVEGADAAPDGKHFKPNANRPDAFDSLRILLRILEDGTATILGMWAATTHAGRYYEQIHLLNPGGAFHIATGRQTAWVMGIYSHGNYEALLQEAPLYGTRDKNKNFKREGPTIHEVVGAHHHWGYDYGKDSVQNSAAGCQVGETEAGHRAFIALLKTDARYKANHQFMWSSTVMPVEWLT